MQSLGILGGTFNPVHIGHLLLAETALTVAHLDRVLWVPNHNPPHRPSTDLIAPRHRVEMVKRAIADHPQFMLADVEAERPVSGYAVDTFYQLKQAFPQTQWSWIVGLDAFKALPRWYRRQDWVTQCCWLVAPRPAPTESTHQTLERFEQDCCAVASALSDQGLTLVWQPLPLPLLDVSSSGLRDACGKGHSIRYWVPESVRHYIQEQALYSQAPQCPSSNFLRLS
jgi:nicotinate-nucleotide adenylyltransferase